MNAWLVTKFKYKLSRIESDGEKSTIDHESQKLLTGLSNVSMFAYGDIKD